MLIKGCQLKDCVEFRMLARTCLRPVRLYHAKVHDHFNNPRNIGKLDAKKKNVGTGMVGAPACGDVMKLMIEVSYHDELYWSL